MITNQSSIKILYASKLSLDNIFVKFGNALCITKILASKTLFNTQAIYVFSSYEYFKTVSKSSLPSPNEKLSYSCIVPSKSIYSSVLANCGKLEYYTCDHRSLTIHRIGNCDIMKMLLTYSIFFAFA